jgi:hypothetical protein
MHSNTYIDGESDGSGSPRGRGEFTTVAPTDSTPEALGFGGLLACVRTVARCPDTGPTAAGGFAARTQGPSPLCCFLLSLRKE